MIKEIISKKKFVLFSPSFVLALKQFIPFFIVIFLAWGFRFDLQELWKECIKILFNGNYKIIMDLGFFPNNYRELMESFIYNMNPFWLIFIPYSLFIFHVFAHLYTVSYYIKNTKFSIESGMFTKNVDWVDFKVIQDIDRYSPFWLRIFGKSNVIFLAEDFSGNDDYMQKTYKVPKHILERVEEANTKSEIRALDIKVFYGIKTKEAQELIEYIKNRQEKLIEHSETVII